MDFSESGYPDSERRKRATGRIGTPRYGWPRSHGDGGLCSLSPSQEFLLAPVPEYFVSAGSVIPEGTDINL